MFFLNREWGFVCVYKVVWRFSRYEGFQGMNQSCLLIVRKVLTLSWFLQSWKLLLWIWTLPLDICIVAFDEVFVEWLLRSCMKWIDEDSFWTLTWNLQSFVFEALIFVKSSWTLWRVMDETWNWFANILWVCMKVRNELYVYDLCEESTCSPSMSNLCLCLWLEPSHTYPL